MSPVLTPDTLGKRVEGRLVGESTPAVITTSHDHSNLTNWGQIDISPGVSSETCLQVRKRSKRYRLVGWDPPSKGASYRQVLAKLAGGALSRPSRTHLTSHIK